MNFVRRLSSQSRPLILLEACVVIAAILVVDYATPLELTMFVFYAVPIFFVSLLCGARAGLTLAVVTVLCSWAVNLGQGQEFGYYLWRGVNRMTSILFVAGCAIAIRREREIFRQRLEVLERSRELEKDIVKISEREQMRIGQDLHDGLCQTLAAIDCAAAGLKTDLEAKGLSEATELAQLQTMLQGACVEARSLARGIFPVQMDTAGLAPALEELIGMLVRTFHVPIDFRVEGDIHIEEPRVGMHLYRIAQEALSNAMRHSGAAEVRVLLRQDAERITLVITDDGHGFDAKGPASGMGLRTIRYRAEVIGADVAITPVLNRGVDVRCSLPLPPERTAAEARFSRAEAS